VIGDNFPISHESTNTGKIIPDPLGLEGSSIIQGMNHLSLILDKLQN